MRGSEKERGREREGGMEGDERVLGDWDEDNEDKEEDGFEDWGKEKDREGLFED